MKQASDSDQVPTLPIVDFSLTDLTEGQLLHRLPAAVYVCDKEGTIIFYNKAAAELWGREPELGKDKWCGSYKILNEDGSEMPLHECPMAICLKEAKAVHGYEIKVMQPNGNIKTVVPYPQPLFNEDGKLTGAINMLVDISDFKRTENAFRESESQYKDLALSLERAIEEKTLDLRRKNEELKKSEERYHKMVDEVEDYAIIFLDQNGIIRNWNKGAEKIKGYKDSEILGKSFEIFYRPEDQASGLPFKLLQQAIEMGKSIHEGWRLRKDGSLFWGSTVVTALHGPGAEIIGFTKVTRDLTAKKFSEDKMKEYTSQLEFQNKELEQFAYAASHDLKEPLRKIHLYNSSVLDNPANVFDQKSREYLTRSVNATKRMNDLIEDLLMYSRTTASKDAFLKVDLGAIVQEVANVYHEDADHKNARIEFGQLPVIKGVPFQIKQLMTNIIGNSLKYKHPDRDAVVQIKHEQAPTDEIPQLDVVNKKKYHKISIIDNGIGFDTEYADKIFDIFQRLNNLPGAKGSGIGLAICKKIVQNHKGWIKASGKPDEGARFDIYIPMDLG